MTIKRIINGAEVEIELTKDEMEKVYRIQELHYYMEDVRAEFGERCGDEETGCLYSNDTVKAIAKYAMLLREHSDYYWESYWVNIDVAIDEYLKNKTGFIKEEK